MLKIESIHHFAINFIAFLAKGIKKYLNIDAYWITDSDALSLVINTIFI